MSCETILSVLLSNKTIVFMSFQSNNRDTDLTLMREMYLSDIYRLNDYLGTLSECWSRNFWKSVRYLSEICQKTVSYKNVSENSHKCVRILSENCQMQISVRTLSEKIWKCIRNVSDFINVSENCQYFVWKTV